MAKLWSYTCGQKSVSRVRVYERSVGASIYVEWYWQSERLQKSLKTVTAHPVTDRKLAMRIAHEMSRKLEQDHNRAAQRMVFGFTTEKTLLEVVQAFHKAKEADWSPKQVKGQRRFRDHWLDRLGEDSALTDVVPAEVEQYARELSVTPETRRKYLRYIKQVYRFAERKLKWIDARHNMDAVDLPKARSESKAYSLDEIRKLLPALEGVDPRAGWLGHVAWQSGRRLTAIRTLPNAAVTCFADHSLLTFPGETDKARKTGEVVVVGRAHELTKAVLPDLLDGVTEHVCIKVWLPAAEKRAGIPHIEGRAWHGIKRRYATESAGMVGRDKQSGTRGDTLDSIYVQDDIPPKMLVAQALADAVSVSILSQST